MPIFKDEDEYASGHNHHGHKNGTGHHTRPPIPKHPPNLGVDYDLGGKSETPQNPFVPWGVPDPRETHRHTPQEHQPRVGIPVASEYHGTHVDSRKYPKNAIVSHTEGSQWFINSFYQQFLGRDNSPNAYSIDLPAVSQQYIRIDKLELRVQSPLTRSFDTNENEFSVVGSSIIYAGVVPNVHDFFTVDIGDGHLGRLSVTAVTPTSYLLNTVYEIQYKLIDYVVPEVQVDLDLKTIERLYYVRGQWNQGHSGVLCDQDYQDYQTLLKLKEILPREHYRDFFSREYQTLLVPDQTATVYDPFLVTFFKRLLDPSEHPWVYKINDLNVDLGYEGEIFTLWDAALASDESILDRCHYKIYPIDVSWFRSQPIYANIAYTGIDTAMYPIDLKIRYSSTTSTIKESFKLQLGPNVTLNRKVSVDEAYSPKTMNILPTDDLGPLEWVSKEILKDTYVFSEAFYRDLPEQSAIELLFRRAVRGEPIPIGSLVKACNDRVLWTSATRFYYIPVLIYILRVALINVS